jgi:hypothetical protein
MRIADSWRCSDVAEVFVRGVFGFLSPWWFSPFLVKATASKVQIADQKDLWRCFYVDKCEDCSFLVCLLLAFGLGRGCCPFPTYRYWPRSVGPGSWHDCIVHRDTCGSSWMGNIRSVALSWRSEWLSPPDRHNQQSIMPSSSSTIRRQLSLILTMKTPLLALLLVYLPIVTAAAAVFNEDACVQCVGSIADWVDTTINNNTTNVTNINDNTFNFNDTDKIYCDQGGDEYVCLTRSTTASTTGSGGGDTTCAGKSYRDEFACRGDLEDFFGFAKSIFIAIIVCTCCCCAAIVAGIAGCVYCCVKGNDPLPAGVPGAYQTNPALLQQQQQQSLAPKPALVLPGTFNMAPPVNTVPAQTGLATTTETAYHSQPSYQPNYQSQSNIPFAEALSVDHDGTTTKRN